MYNKIYKYFGILVFAFFVSTSIVHADVAILNTNSGASIHYPSDLGRTTSSARVGIYYASSTAWSPETISFQICRSWEAINQNVYAVFTDDEMNVIATSTNVYDTSIENPPSLTAGECLATPFSFTFNESLVYDSGTYYVGLVYSPTYSNSSHYLKISHYTNSTTNADISGVTGYIAYYTTAFPPNRLSISGFSVYTENPPFVCGDSGGGGTIECDMSSTTDAIYTVGYTTNFILGIFLIIIFGTLSFIFFKGYIS